jgi:arginine decarboxylase
MEEQEKKPQSDYLNAHYNASRLRSDTWNRLKYKSLKITEMLRETASSNRIDKLRTVVADYLDILEPIEYYWAFPGREAFREIRRLFERGEYRQFDVRVSRVVQMLFSESYRVNTEWMIQHQLEESTSIRRVDERKRHYFEVLYVAKLNAEDERTLRQRFMALQREGDNFAYNLLVVPSFEDALIATMLNHNIQSCVIHYGFALRSHNPLHVLQGFLPELEDSDQIHDNFTMEHGSNLGRILHNIRPELDLFLITDDYVEDFATYDVHQSYRRVFYGKESIHELHLSILRGIYERYETPFFTALVEYSKRPTGVFHALPLSRGHSISRSHWIQDMGDFYGTNIFMAETSATTGGLDSLLQPRGPLKKAQERAAKAFGAQHSFFVTNGTSTANKIVLQALVQPGDFVLVDRDCHKSHHYGLVLSGAYPVYLDSYPLVQYSMYGAVPLHEIKKKLLEFKAIGQLHRVKMLLLTNCTFDGIVYNTERVMEEVLAIKPDMIFLWDEAWFGFARFNPIYRNRTAMQAARNLHRNFQSTEYRARFLESKKQLKKLGVNNEEAWLETRLAPDPDQTVIRVYSTQSTHKTLSSLRQGAMIHIYDQEFRSRVEDSFHEAYMTHTSTSPNYQILASLDVARRQVEFEGYELVQKSIENAMTLREKIKTHPLLKKYFHALGPSDLIPSDYRPSGLQSYYDIRHGWQQMNDAWTRDEFVLDPTRLTLFTGLTGINGDTFKNVYLMDRHGIQVNKTSRNTVLFMTNIGTTRSAVAFLIGVLVKIAQELKERDESLTAIERMVLSQQVASLTTDLPPLPDFSYFHPKYSPMTGVNAGDIRRAFFDAMNEDNVEYLKMDGSVLRAIDSGRTVVSGSFVTPYPPGFPILVPGQVITREILRFLKALDVKEIHGYRPELGLKLFNDEYLNRTTPQHEVGVSNGTAISIAEPIEHETIQSNPEA